MRGRAFLEAGAECVFVPRAREAAHIEALVSELGERRLSVIAMPGGLPAAELERMGVARVSMGPWGYRVALTALQDATTRMLDGGALPEHVRPDALP
jgi:2-methylisocitrate lyase-like PEP mutase family enzyme